jgi:site-specific recombinase XerD
VAAAIRFFYVETLDWPPLKLHLPPRPAPKRLPKVLSLEDVERLLICTRNPKHRALLMTTYAAGFRVSEVVHLQVTDIESHPERMLIRINQGKGQKDRYTLLSTRLLQELRAYWRLERPTPWLFPGHDPKRPMPSGTAGKIYERARQRAGLAQGRGIHTLRNASTYCYTSLIRIDFPWLAIRGCAETGPVWHLTQLSVSLRAMKGV